MEPPDLLPSPASSPDLLPSPASSPDALPSPASSDEGLMFGTQLGTQQLTAPSFVGGASGSEQESRPGSRGPILVESGMLCVSTAQGINFVAEPVEHGDALELAERPPTPLQPEVPPWDASHPLTYSNQNVQTNLRSYFDRTRERQKIGDPPDNFVTVSWKLDPEDHKYCSKVREKHTADASGYKMTKSWASQGLATVGTSWPDNPSWSPPGGSQVWHPSPKWEGTGKRKYQTAQRARRAKSSDWVYFRGLERNRSTSKVLSSSHKDFRRLEPREKPMWRENFQVVFSKKNQEIFSSAREYFQPLPHSRELPRPSILIDTMAVGGRAGGGSRGIASERYFENFYPDHPRGVVKPSPPSDYVCPDPRLCGGSDRDAWRRTAPAAGGVSTRQGGEPWGARSIGGFG